MSAIKNIVRSAVDQFDFLKRNRLYYHIQRYRQYSPCGADHSLTTHHEELDILLKDGILLIENFISPEDCDKIHAEYMPIVEKIRDREYDGHHQRISSYFHRIGSADKISARAKELFFDNEFIAEMSRAYVSKKAYSYRHEVDYKVVRPKDNVIWDNFPHFDDWRYRFKAFLYVTDVKAENAPFVYYKGSHEQAKWKYPYHLDYEINGQSKGKYGQFQLDEWEEIRKEHNYEKFTCIAPKGTLILADFRGIHSGTPMQAGHRMMLNSVWGI